MRTCTTTSCDGLSRSGGPVWRSARTAEVFWDVWRAGRGDAAGIERRQQRRLRALVECARARSPYYRAALSGLPTSGPVRLVDLPPVTKTEMMRRFDDWVTDPAVTRAGVQEFLHDPARVGETFLGRYLVTTTSGSTGSPAVVLFDARARQVATAIAVVRGVGSVPWGQWRRVLRLGGRQVAIFATGGHFLAETFLQHRFRTRPIRRRFARLLSVMTPLDELVDELNAFGPAFLGSYPSVLDLLAREQEAGRLHIAPAVVTSGGEHLSAPVRARLTRQWDCRVWDSYNATEAMPLTIPCAVGRFHVNADWIILEPVDADRRPVPPGTPSVTTLVTNLTDHVQPIIRYELGDSVTLAADGCRCGSPLPVVTVVGRSNDVLRFSRPEGPVEIPPLALGSVIEQTVGVRRYQAIQTGPATLTVRVETERGSDPDRVWVDLTRRLRDFLTRQGLGNVDLSRDRSGPQPEPHSGKLRQVICAFDG